MRERIQMDFFSSEIVDVLIGKWSFHAQCILIESSHARAHANRGDPFRLDTQRRGQKAALWTEMKETKETMPNSMQVRSTLSMCSLGYHNTPRRHTTVLHIAQNQIVTGALFFFFFKCKYLTDNKWLRRENVVVVQELGNCNFVYEYEHTFVLTSKFRVLLIIQQHTKLYLCAGFLKQRFPFRQKALLKHCTFLVILLFSHYRVGNKLVSLVA